MDLYPPPGALKFKGLYSRARPTFERLFVWGVEFCFQRRFIRTHNFFLGTRAQCCLVMNVESLGNAFNRRLVFETSSHHGEGKNVENTLRKKQRGNDVDKRGWRRRIFILGKIREESFGKPVEIVMFSPTSWYCNNLLSNSYILIRKLCQIRTWLYLSTNEKPITCWWSLPLNMKITRFWTHFAVSSQFSSSLLITFVRPPLPGVRGGSICYTNIIRNTYLSRHPRSN